MTIALRYYQSNNMEEIRDAYAAGKKRVCLVSPTGSGKSIVLSAISAGVFKKGKRVYIAAPRDELITQLSESLKKFGISHGTLRGGQIGVPAANIIVASVYTLAKRAKKMKQPDLLVLDEGHHTVFGEGVYWNCIAAFPKALVLCCTATPCRLDMRGLGDVYDDMVLGPSVAELTALGFLVPVEVYAPPRAIDLRGVRSRMGDYAIGDLEKTMDKPSITGDAVDHYRRLADGLKGVAFCCSVKHAEDVAAEFNAAGYPAASVDGRMDVFDRHKVITDFRNGKIKILASCQLVSEGFDLPDIEVGIMLRPTQSLSLMIQQVGRIIRPMPGKSKAIMLDHAGLVSQHGFIDEPRNWALTFTETKQQRGIAVPRVVTCPKCFAMHRPSPVCPRCKHIYETAGRVVEQVDGELVQMTRTDEMDQALRDAAEMKDLERLYAVLVNVAKGRNYSDPPKWAFDIVCGHAAKKKSQQRDPSDIDTINGLTAEELQDLRAATIMKAMSKEDQPHLPGV